MAQFKERPEGPDLEAAWTLALSLSMIEPAERATGIQLRVSIANPGIP
jgi:hypothetical protein